MNVVGHLSVLESAGLVGLAQVMPDVEYLFRHTLVQEVAYASLLERDQKRLHRQVGEAIELLYPQRLDELSPSLARHFEAAGESEKAAVYYERAAKMALEAYAHQEAQGHFLNALRLTESPRQSAALMAGLGEAFFQDSRFDEAILRWQEAIKQYKLVNDMDHIARLYARAGRAAWFNSNHFQGLELCLEGMNAIGKTENSPYSAESHGVAFLLHETGRAYYFNGKQQQALALCREALSMAERLGAVDVQADSLTTIGIIPDVSADERLAALTKAVELAEASGALSVASRAHFNLGGVMINYHEDLEGGLGHYLKAAEMAHRYGSVQQEIFYRCLVTEIKLKQGKYAEAEQILEELKEKQKSLIDPGASGLELRMLNVSILHMHGELEPAIDDMRQCLQSARQRGHLEAIINSLAYLIIVLIEQHRMELADTLDEAASLLPEIQTVVDQGMGMQSFFQIQNALILAFQGRFSEARQLVASTRQESPGKSHKGLAQEIMRVELETAILERNWDGALEIYEQLKEHRLKIGPWYWARILTQVGKMHLERGEAEDLEEAQVLLLEAQEFFQQFTAPIYLNQIENLLQASRRQTLAQAAAQRLVAQELAQAGRIQSSFFPDEPPTIPGWQIAAKLRSARQTTGDYYDFIPMPDGRLGIVIADVADKGMGAALVMASSLTLLRAFATENTDAPEKVLLKANQRITQDTHGGLFVTLFYGILDPASGRLVYCNAGHNPPYLMTASDEVHSLAKTGIPLGIFNDASWQTHTANMDTDSILVLYTDGVTEAAGPGDNYYGEARLLQAMQQAPRSQPAAQTLQSILASVDSFRGKTPQSDDITLVIIRREGQLISV